MAAEQWRDVPGFEGCYQASDQGRVRSVDRVAYCGSRHGGMHPRKYKGKMLTAAPHPAGYLQLALYDKGVQHSFTVHVLVALTFIGPCPRGYDVMHLDHNKRNNAASNLRYGTRGENVAADFAAGTRVVHSAFIGARWRARDNSVS